MPGPVEPPPRPPPGAPLADPAEEERGVKRPRPLDVARAGENAFEVEGHWFKKLRSRGEVVGSSIRCPTCGGEKDLHWAKSLPEEEGLRRLIRWSEQCRGDHKKWGGRLLCLCVD